MRAFTSLLAIMSIVGCGTPASEDADSGPDGIAPQIDAAFPTDAQPPLRFVEPIWERGVYLGEADLHQSVVLPGGIAVIATPQSTIYNRDGDRTFDAAWPPELPMAGDWSLLRPIALDSGDFAVVTKDLTDQRVVRRFDGTNLSQLSATALDPAILSTSIIELDGIIYVLSRSIGNVFQLHTITEGVLTESRTVEFAHTYGLSAHGFAMTDGKLLFCGMDPTGIVVIRMDPVTATATTLDLNIQNSISGCRMARGDNHIMLLWERYGRREWVLLDAEGTQLVAGPMTAEDFGRPRLEVSFGLVYVAGQFVSIGFTETRLLLYGFDEMTGEVSRPWDVRLEPFDVFWDADMTLASDGQHLYVGMGVSPAPYRIKLQKLPPLSIP